MLLIFYSPVKHLTQQLQEPPHQYLLHVVLYHQLGKYMMERMGGMEQEPCVRFFVSAGQVWEVGYGKGYNILAIYAEEIHVHYIIIS